MRYSTSVDAVLFGKLASSALSAFRKIHLSACYSLIMGIPMDWLIRWGTNQQDKRKAEVVQEIVCTFALQHTNPELARQIAEMLANSNRLQLTNNFNAPVGAVMGNVEKITFKDKEHE